MSVIKSFIKYTIAIGLVAIIIAALFVLFQDSEEVKILLKFFLFPGALFVILAALFYNWFDRKMFARMQNRIGPRFIQPVYDLLKLLAKEDITPEGVDKTEFDAIPAVQLIVAILISFTVPVYIYRGLISFEGDIIFILFLLALIGGSIFLLGWSTNNPYGLIGASRAIVAELSFEIPLALSFIGPAILAGSLQLSNVATRGYTLLDLPLRAISETGFIIAELTYLIPLFVLFVLAIMSATALLEKVPFDPAHAEVEIVGGWTVEISGKKLLFTRLTNFILEFSIAGIIAAVFLGSPTLNTLITPVGVLPVGNWDVLVYLINISLFAMKTTVVVFLITLMRTLHSRIRIDQLVRYFWRYYLPIALLALLVIITLVMVI
ncbi:MAG: complex I subunit 1/NuoH family protein [Candidatus Hodarchaeales archaeon]|jgi:NADH-quinone oxidoreductase subunit H